MVQPTKAFQYFFYPSKPATVPLLQFSFNSLTFEVIVESVNEVSARAEVNESNLLWPRVDQDILVLDVPVENTSVVAEKDCLKNLNNFVMAFIFEGEINYFLVEEKSYLGK